MNNTKLTKEEILTRVTQRAIWERYFNDRVSTKRLYRNPRRPDNKPGCRFYYSKSGILYFHDFSTGDMWDCFSWVEEEYGCNFFEALKIINQDFGLGIGFYRSSFPETKQTKRRKIVDEEESQQIEVPRWNVTTTDFDDEDLKYWKQFNINEDILSYYNVFKVDIAENQNNSVYQSKEGDPVYAYIFPKYDRLKLYRPLTTNKRYKWGGYCTKEVLQGYSQLPKTGDLLVITKSLKDVMTLCSLGYNAVAPSGETTLISEETMDELRERFSEVILLFDNDGGFTKKEGKGKYASLRYNEKFDIPYTFISEESGTKDISDFVSTYGVMKARDELKKILKNG